MTESVHQWLAAYAAHLREGTRTLQACSSPDAAWRDRCQEFDDQVRAFGGDALRTAVTVTPGPELLADLRACQRAFEAASAAHVRDLDDRLQGVARGRKGLRGYEKTGRDMTRGSALYLERRY